MPIPLLQRPIQATQRLKTRLGNQHLSISPPPLSPHDWPAEWDVKRGKKWRLFGERPQILHVKLFYYNGQVGELNITSPNPGWGDDIELQYYYIRQYLDRQWQRLGIMGYQGNIAYIHRDTGEFRILGAYKPHYYVTFSPQPVTSR